MELLLDPQMWIAFGMLAMLEIVLGVDNIIFISILASRLPEDQRRSARLLGLALAMLTRIMLLFSLSWVMSLKEPLFKVFQHPFSGRYLLLLGGGLFLVAKATREIHERIEGEGDEISRKNNSTFIGTLIQIMILDIVFSLDSVITAVGMVDELWIMVTAVVISVLTMMVFSTSVSNFISKHPTVKMLALSFLLLIGVVLVGDALGHHIAKGYIYGAMAFSVFVEILNLAASRKKKEAKAHQAS